jgi:sarcosine oxidase, subunit beta
MSGIIECRLAISAPERNSSDTMSETDILIIVGGIAGVSTAYHLSEYGCDVTLLERGEIASEASGVNACDIGAIGWGNVPTLNSHLTMGSLEIFKSLQLDLGHDIEYRQSGALEAIQTEEQYQYARDRVLSLRSQGYRVELLTNREARGMEPGLNPGLPVLYTCHCAPRPTLSRLPRL